MKISSQVIEVQPRTFSEKDGTEKKSVRVTAIVPHDDPTFGFQSISGSLDPSEVQGAEKIQKFPVGAQIDVSLAQRQVNGYAATVLRLSHVQIQP